MSIDDYYELLGVPKDAEASAIKKAYREQAMKYHPDRNSDPEAEDRFKKIGDAYSVLSDENKRQVYDRYGHEGLKNQGFSGSSAQDIFNSFGDIFGDLFGFSGGGRRSHRGADLRIKLILNLEECLKIQEQKIKIPRKISCRGCDGSGAEPGSQVQTCPTCQGRGQVAVGRGFISMSTTCPSCHGEGKFIPNPCHECRGKGQIQEEREVKVTIPAGVETGNRLRLSGMGEGGPPGGESGDLYVHIEIEEHPRFERHGADLLQLALRCRLPPRIWSAPLWGPS